MTPEPQGLRADARRNYDLLLQTARSMLSLPNAVLSFNALAKRAGVGIGTLYRHFPTKQTLLEIIYADEVEMLNHVAPSAVSADHALETWLKELVNLAVQSPGFELLVNETLQETDSPLFLAASKHLKLAQKAGALRRDVNTQELLGLVKGIVGSAQKAQQVNKMLSVIMAGLRK